MEKLAKHPITPAEQYYDDCFSRCQEDDSDKNAQALHFAEVEMWKERKHTKAQEERILRELNQHLNQGRTSEQLSLSEGLISTVFFLLSASAIAVLVWWLVQNAVER